MGLYDKLRVTPRADAPMARFESAVAVVRGKMYVIGGHLEPELSATNAVYAYDPAADRWDRKRDAPKPISHLTAAVQDDRYIWLAGGYEGQHPGTGVKTTARYDAIEDRWDDGPPLPEVRASGGLAVMGRQLHYFGGLDADRCTNRDDHWVLDMDNPDAWRRLCGMPEARTHAATAVLDGKIYAIGGHLGHDLPGLQGIAAAEPDLDCVHMFDPNADRWEEVEPLSRRRSHCEPGTFVHEGRIICIGGRNNSPTGRCRCEGTLAHHIFRRLRYKLDVATGLRPKGSSLNDVIAYDPESGRWEDLGQLPQTLYAPAAHVIDDRIILTNGGQNGWRDPSDATFELHL